MWASRSIDNGRLGMLPRCFMDNCVLTAVVTHPSPVLPESSDSGTHAIRKGGDSSLVAPVDKPSSLTMQLTLMASYQDAITLAPDVHQKEP